MSETLFERRRPGVDTMRVHDYLYDSAFIVSGARDYARAAFKAAMASAQINVQPLYKTMFSELKHAPGVQIVYHPNCRLPRHMDRSYAAYVARLELDRNAPTPQLTGKDRYRFEAKPKKLLDMTSVTPQFQPPSPVLVAGDCRPKNKGTQSKYRESSAQTVPWQPDGKKADDCEETPEVMYLDKLEWGPGKPFRLGDLPADFHTTEIINKMRHARTWTSVVENAQFPRWMKRRDDIIGDVETRDWIFREAEIDELQDIRLELLHQLQRQQRSKQSTRTRRKLANLWAGKKLEMERRVDAIRKARDREIRKLNMAHEYGREGLVGRYRGVRGGGSVTYTAADPTSDLHAPLARHGYQARRKHAVIYYDPSLLAFEDHEKLSKPPAWLDECGQNLKKSCSGHHLPRDPMQLCERETKWSEEFLEQLHNDLKKARLGAGAGAGGSAGPLRVLRPRRVRAAPRPATPEVDGVQDGDERSHQAALTLQRIIRGRAVQCLVSFKLCCTGGSAGPLRVLRPRRVRAAPRPATPEVDGVQDGDERSHQAALTLQRIIRGRAVQCLVSFKLCCTGGSAGPLRVLRPRRVRAAPRPATPEVDGVQDGDERSHQAALTLQRIIRGRAVQCLVSFKLCCTGGSAGPLRVLRPRRVRAAPRPATPEVDGVQDGDERSHQAALTLQRIIRGRAVQCLVSFKLCCTGGSAGPLRVLRPRRVRAAPRPATPEVDGVQDGDERSHQAALTLQRIIRGRAVQCLMYEGRTRAAELTEELKTTHGLQKEDKIHIAKEEAYARDHHVIQTQADQEETAIATLVDELCGSTVSAALDFLEKELRRLKEERRQHAFLLIAVRDKAMREAAEAGRRQKEEHRRREHDDMFRQIIGVTQETVDAYLHDVIAQGVELGVEEDAVRRAERRADEIDKEMKENDSMSTAEQNELVAELVQQFLLPEAHKCASRHRVAALQHARTEAARKTIFGLIDDAETKEDLCIHCGQHLDDQCRCRSCKLTMTPTETAHRRDWRWKRASVSPPALTKTTGQRFPPAHETRRLLNAIVDDAVLEARRRFGDRQFVRSLAGTLREKLEGELEARDLLDHAIDLATGVVMAPARRRPGYGYVMKREIPDALERTVPFPGPSVRPKELPSEIRAREIAEVQRRDPYCYCLEKHGVMFTLNDMSEKERAKLLPSDVRELEDSMRCKCDHPTPTPSRHVGLPGRVGTPDEEDVRNEVDSDNPASDPDSPEIADTQED